MADEKAGKDDAHKTAMGDVFFVLGLLGVLIALWFFSGGPERASLKGLFLAPPAPLGSGESYGPQFGEPNPNYETSGQ